MPSPKKLAESIERATNLMSLLIDKIGDKLDDREVGASARVLVERVKSLNQTMNNFTRLELESRAMLKRDEALYYCRLLGDAVGDSLNMLGDDRLRHTLTDDINARFTHATQMLDNYIDEHRKVICTQ